MVAKMVVKTTQQTTRTTDRCPVPTASTMIPWTMVTIWTEGNNTVKSQLYGHSECNEKALFTRNGVTSFSPLFYPKNLTDILTEMILLENRIWD